MEKFGFDRVESAFPNRSPAARYQMVRSVDRKEQAALNAQIEQAAAAQIRER